MNDYKATVLQLLADIGSADPPAGPVISTSQFHAEVLRLLGEIASGGGGGGGGLVANVSDAGELDKTWQEIHDAMPMVWVKNANAYYPMVGAGYDPDDGYWCEFADLEGFTAYFFSASSADEYPHSTD